MSDSGVSHQLSDIFAKLGFFGAAARHIFLLFSCMDLYKYFLSDFYLLLSNVRICCVFSSQLNTISFSFFQITPYTLHMILDSGTETQNVCTVYLSHNRSRTNFSPYVSMMVHPCSTMRSTILIIKYVYIYNRFVCP